MRRLANYQQARDLRRKMTRPEVDLWTRLRDRSEGFSFRRQHPMGGYIADFYCARIKLVVEVDGEAHERGEQPERDAIRDRWFAEQGIETLRINAADIRTDADDVAEGILRYVREKLRT